jgi:hypothetical protein
MDAMRRSREQWAQIVEQFERSGQSHEAFCAQHRLRVWSFRGWLYRLRRGAQEGKVARSATRLLPVHVTSVGATVDEMVIELSAGDAALRIRGNFGPAYVAELVGLLRARC